MPFSKDFDDVFQSIRKAAARKGLSCRRADEIARAGLVLRAIQEKIVTASVVVADLSRGNSNVFYETAFAHNKKSPEQVILIAQEEDHVPSLLFGRTAVRKDRASASW